MSKKLYEETNIQAIANAIREKNNTQNQYTTSQMPNAIRQIHGEPDLETLTVIDNGNYLPSAGKDGFSEVVVSVPNSYTNSDEGKVVKNGALVSQMPRAAVINENGTYDTTENNSVVVTVPSGGGSGDEQTVYWGDEEPLSNLGNNGDVYIRGNIYVFRDSGGKVLRVVNKDYVVTSTSQILSTHSSVFQKTVEGPAIAIECQTNGHYEFKGPVLISPVADYVKYTGNQVPWGHVDIDDVTWYIGSFGNYSAAEDSPSIPTYYGLATDLGNVPSSFNSTYAEALVRKFFELAVPSLYRSVYVKRNGAWEIIDKELNLEILNATNNGRYDPSLGKDGFGKVIVSVSGGGENQTEATAIVQNNAVVVDGCNIVSQPAIIDGEMTATASSGLQISPTYLSNVCLEVDYKYTNGPSSIVFSLGGSNTASGILGLSSTTFEFYASGSQIKRTDLNINFNQARHVKFIATKNNELYVVVDDSLILSASNNRVNNIFNYCLGKSNIAIGWNQSAHAEYNSGTFNNIKISFDVDLPST